MCIPSRSTEAVIRVSRDSFCLIHTWVQLSVKQSVRDFIFVLLLSSLSPPAQLTQPTGCLLPVSGGDSSLNNGGCFVCLPSTHEGHVCLTAWVLYMHFQILCCWALSPAENSLGGDSVKKDSGREKQVRDVKILSFETPEPVKTRSCSSSLMLKIHSRWRSE